jgi:hypothetical protein
MTIYGNVRAIVLSYIKYSDARASVDALRKTGFGVSGASIAAATPTGLAISRPVIPPKPTAADLLERKAKQKQNTGNLSTMG